MNLDEIRKQAQRFLAGEAEAETLLNALDAWRTAQLMELMIVIVVIGILTATARGFG